jgi:hypothetical protein
MQITLQTYRKNKLAAWLVCINFLVSVSFFTGYTGKSVVHCKQPVQTVQQCSYRSKSTMRSISYKKANAALCEMVTKNNSANYKSSRFTYNKLVKVKFINARKLFCTAEIKYKLIRNTLLTNSPEEPLAPSLA